MTWSGTSSTGSTTTTQWRRSTISSRGRSQGASGVAGASSSRLSRQRLGGYFANNSRVDDAQVDFYDENGDWIDSATATIPNSGGWSWNGWESDVPIKWIVIAGNDEGFGHAFIWVDDVQIN